MIIFLFTVFTYMYGTVVPVISCTDSDETLVFIISVPIDRTFNCKNKCGKPLLVYRFLIVEKCKKKTRKIYEPENII